nr:uncharacterized protein LOC100186669 [Ciona intestinalis]|eukprot:XP_002128177.1 uncharacterized protein LOC100186669 [Ciona intestinalis]
MRHHFFPTTTTYTNTEVTTDEIISTNISGLRIPFTIIGLLFSVASLYVFLSITIHRLRAIKRQKKEEIAQRQQSVRSRRSKGTSPYMDNLSVVASMFAFMNCVSDQPLLYIKSPTNVTCKIIQSLSFVLYSAGIVCLYSFLWFRQRACYKNPTLSEMHGKFARILSSTILPLFIIMMLAGMILTGALWEFTTSDIGCIEVAQTRTPLIVLFTGAVAMQGTLLTLFVYPLKRHAGFATSNVLPSDKLLMALVKRSIITTGLCVLADALAFIIAVALPTNTPFIVTNLLYDANLVCNVVCVVGSFADWRQRLAPWLRNNANRCELIGSMSRSSRTTALTTTTVV